MQKEGRFKIKVIWHGLFPFPDVTHIVYRSCRTWLRKQHSPSKCCRTAPGRGTGYSSASSTTRPTLPPPQGHSHSTGLSTPPPLPLPLPLLHLPLSKAPPCPHPPHHPVKLVTILRYNLNNELREANVLAAQTAYFMPPLTSSSLPFLPSIPPWSPCPTLVQGLTCVACVCVCEPWLALCHLCPSPTVTCGTWHMCILFVARCYCCCWCHVTKRLKETDKSVSLRFIFTPFILYFCSETCWFAIGCSLISWSTDGWAWQRGSLPVCRDVLLTMSIKKLENILVFMFR